MPEKRKCENNEALKKNKQIKSTLLDIIVSNDLKQSATNTLILQNKCLEDEIDTKLKLIETLNEEREILFKMCRAILNQQDLKKLINIINNQNNVKLEPLLSEIKFKNIDTTNNSALDSENKINREIIIKEEDVGIEKIKENLQTNAKDKIDIKIKVDFDKEKESFGNEVNFDEVMNENGVIINNDNAKNSEWEKYNSDIQKDQSLLFFKEFYIDKLYKKINDQNDIITELKKKLLRKESQPQEIEQKNQEFNTSKNNNMMKEYIEENNKLELRNAEIVSEILSNNNKYINDLKAQKDFYLSKLNNLIKTTEMYKKLLNEKDNEIDNLKKSEHLQNEYIESQKKFQEMLDELRNTRDNSRHYFQVIHLTNRYQEEMQKNIKHLEKINYLTNINERLKNKCDEIVQVNEVEFYKEKENLVNELAEYVNKYEERKNAAMFHKRASIKFEMEMHAYSKQLKELQESLSNTTSPNSSKDTENLRSLLRCTACDNNFKNTVLLRCMHVFCNDCIEERIKKRKRNCPNCNENFHTADVKRIFL